MKDKNRTNWRSTLVAGIVAFSLTSGVTAAMAASSSVKSVGTFAGYSYTNQAVLNNLTGSSLRSFTLAKMTSGGSVPANYYGAQPRTFAGGTLCASGGMTYNTTGVVGITPHVDGICDPGIGHYSTGRTTHFDGSAYNTYSTYTTTPNVYP